MWTSSGKSKTSDTQAKESKRASSVVSVFHIGQDLCGHPGFVHGGLLSVLFDEVFARCVSAAFPSGLGMTANLNVDFRKPALPDRMYVLRVETTKVEGRKAWVEGKMTYLPLALPHSSVEGGIVTDAGLLSEESEGAVMVAEARALFIEPKFADVSFSFLSLILTWGFANQCFSPWYQSIRASLGFLGGYLFCLFPTLRYIELMTDRLIEHIIIIDLLVVSSRYHYSL
jgi:acyl-coenzyme A thioesterase PaaI-like protein